MHIFILNLESWFQMLFLPIEALEENRFWNSICRHITGLWNFEILAPFSNPFLPLRIHNSRSSEEWTLLFEKMKSTQSGEGKLSSNYANLLTCMVALTHLSAKPVGLLLYYKKNKIHYSVWFLSGAVAHCFRSAQEKEMYKNCYITESHFMRRTFFVALVRVAILRG